MIIKSPLAPPETGLSKGLRRLLQRGGLILGIVILIFNSALYAAEVKNLRTKQVGSRVLFEFDVEGNADEEAEISITLTIKGTTYTADRLHLEGDHGKVKAGKGKKVWWNVLQDFPKGYSGEPEVEIIAGSRDFKDPVTGMEFVFVKGGCFQMGDSIGDGEAEERPVHEVCVDDFYIGKYEVTQAQWKDVMGDNPSYFKDCGDDCPVENISWDDAQEFIKRLTSKMTLKRMKNNPSVNKGEEVVGSYRLPTEAEWEYAARSGGKREKYAGADNADSVAWYGENSDSKTHPVGQKKPNGLGIYDMSGNVREFVQDMFDENYYKNSPKDNPKGPGSGQYCVVRGGSWGDVSWGMRTANRALDVPLGRDGGLGFRVAGIK